VPRRILIHAVSAKPRGGADRHFTNFLPNVALADNRNEYVVCVHERFEVRPVGHNIQFQRVAIHSAAQRVWWDQIRLPLLLKEMNIDLLVAILSFGCMRPPCPQVSFLRNPLHCPHYLRGLGLQQRAAVHMRRWYLRKTLEASSMIVTPSSAMRDVIREAIPALTEKAIEVLPHALAREGESDSTESTKNADGPVRLLYVGHLLPYKGFDVLIESLARLKHEKLAFVVDMTVAAEDWPEGFTRLCARLRELDLEDRVNILGKVSLSSVRQLYAASDLLLFPSLCESFGFPIVEAMQRGLPILAVDTPLAREMAGDAALYYGIDDVDAATDRLRRLITAPEIRARLSKVGRAKAVAHLDWAEYARRCVDIFERMIRERVA
jgi:glycosyltransferase involved in cell wall biosynthesis